MRRRKRLKKIFILPPVLLAALLIWLVISQRANSRPEAGFMDDVPVEHFLASDREPDSGLQDSFRLPAGKDGGENLEGLPEEPVLKIETGKKGGNLPGSDNEFGHLPGAGDSGKLSLLFCGDIYLSDHVLNAYDRAGGISGVLDEGLRNEIASADIFMANEEFPFSERGIAAEDKQYTFRLPPSRMNVMQEIGPDIVALANNHILDYGTDALLDTCALLDGAGIRRVGAGAGLDEAKKLEVMEAKGKKIGFLAASRVIPVSSWAAGRSHPGVLTTYDPSILLNEIKAAQGQCDYLVVYVHWGIERNTQPEEYQRTLARQYIDAGADLVVGSHPHVLQGIEYYKGKPILYSLGNFVFGSVIPQTMMVRVELDEANQAVLSVVPATSSAGYTRQMDVSKWPEFFEELKALSFDITVDGDGAIHPGTPQSP